MFPTVTVLGMDLYTLMIAIGVLTAIVLFRVFCDKRQLPAKVFNFSLFIVLGAILAGYFSAVLFQAVYSWRKTGVWQITGATFSGGLIGAVVFFFLIYFIVGHFVFKKREHVLYLNTMTCCAFPCIVIAHSLGRIGCLFAGCCYGKETTSWLGINMLIGETWQKRLPTQLFEALFLAVLFVVLTYLLLKRKSENIVSLYLFSYGIWRFFIEFVRDDERGTSIVPFLTPSQTISVLMIICGVALLLVRKYVLVPYYKKLEQLDD